MILRVLALLLALSSPALAQLSVTELSGFGGGGSSTQFKVQASGIQAAATATTITIPVDFGEGGTMALVLDWRCGANRTVSSVTLNGVTATIDKQVTAATATINILIASASGVPGGSGNVVVTMSASDTYNGVYGVYIIPGALTGTASIAAGTSTTLNVNAGGAILGGFYNTTNTTTPAFSAGVVTDARDPAWTGVGSRVAEVGSQFYAAAATPATLTIAASVTNAIFAAYGP